MSDRINLLLAVTGSTDTAGDETRGSYLSNTSQSTDCSESDEESSSTGSSYASSKSYTEGGSYTEAEEFSVGETCASNFEEYENEEGDDEEAEDEEDEEEDDGDDEESLSDTSDIETDTTIKTESTNEDGNRSISRVATNRSAVIDEKTLSASSAHKLGSYSTDNDGGQLELSSKHENGSNVSASRKRVPGGAAAKLMFVGPKGSTDEVDVDNEGELKAISSTESTLANESAVNETIGREMRRAKDEFKLGSPRRKSAIAKHQEHLHNLNKSQLRDDISETSSNAFSNTPSFLNRNEIFHKTAAAAVAALLTPRGGSMLAPSNSDVSTGSKSNGGTPSSRAGAGVGFDTGKKLPSSPENHNQSNSPGYGKNLITPKTEEVLEAMNNHMHNPNATLTELLTAIATPENKSNDDSLNDLGYMIRRKNACGALQVLSSHQSNRVRICWTAGVLPALASVLIDGTSHKSLAEVFPDRRVRDEYSTARIRAISALMNFAMPPKNRIPVFHTPQLVQALVFIIANDHEGLARRGCCAILAFLAKSVDNRQLMMHVPDLLESVRKVIQPRPPRMEPIKEEKKKQLYPWSEEGEDDNSELSNASSHTDDEHDKSDRNDVSNSIQGDQDSHDEVESGSTPKVKGSKTPRELAGYDETANELLRAARQNIFAVLGHLVKEKDNAYHMGREVEFLETIIAISAYKESESHEFAVRLMANLTRHRLNKQIAFKPKTFVPALVEATQSPSDDTRLHAIYGLQNLSQEKSCRQELAISSNLIIMLCDRCRNGEQEEERLAAISTLKNLCDEPANLIPMTNTPGCVSTLMQFAHGGINDITKGSVTEMMQYRACDALATLSHWLRKISTSGYALESNHSNNGGSNNNNSSNSTNGRASTVGGGGTITRGGGLAKGQLFVPSLREISWNQWQ